MDDGPVPPLKENLIPDDENTPRSEKTVYTP